MSCLMTRMELGPNVPNHLSLRAGIHPAFGHLTGAPVNDFVPLRLGVRVLGVIKAGNELAQMGQRRKCWPGVRPSSRWLFKFRVRRGTWVRMSDYEVEKAQRKLK